MRRGSRTGPREAGAGAMNGWGVSKYGASRTPLVGVKTGLPASPPGRMLPWRGAGFKDGNVRAPVRTPPRRNPAPPLRRGNTAALPPSHRCDSAAPESGAWWHGADTATEPARHNADTAAPESGAMRHRPDSAADQTRPRADTDAAISGVAATPRSDTTQPRPPWLIRRLLLQCRHRDNPSLETRN